MIRTAMLVVPARAVFVIEIDCNGLRFGQIRLDQSGRGNTGFVHTACFGSAHSRRECNQNNR